MPVYLAGIGMQQLSFLAILLAAFLLNTEWIRNDTVAVFIILALAVAQMLAPSEAMTGCGSEAALVAAFMFVLGAALRHIYCTH